MRRQGQGVVRAAWVAAGAVVVLAVGGCTGEPEPVRTTDTVVTPSATPSPQPSRPPRPEEPERPAAMDEGTVDGAAAAATYFFGLYDYAFATGDASPFRRLSAPGCVFCSTTIGQVEQAVEDDLLTDRDPSEISDLSVVEVRPGEWFNVELRRRQGAIRVLGDDGTVLAEEPVGTALDFGLALSWTDAGWSVDEVGLTAEPQG